MSADVIFCLVRGKYLIKYFEKKRELIDMKILHNSRCHVFVAWTKFFRNNFFLQKMFLAKFILARGDF